MIRALAIAALVGGLSMLVWAPLGLPVTFLVWFGLLMAPGFITRCPWCRRRVPLGASVCHRCSRAIR